MLYSSFNVTNGHVVQPVDVTNFNLLPFEFSSELYFQSVK